jgi:hypothetical protein
MLRAEPLEQGGRSSGARSMSMMFPVLGSDWVGSVRQVRAVGDQYHLQTPTSDHADECREPSREALHWGFQIMQDLVKGM